MMSGDCFSSFPGGVCFELTTLLIPDENDSVTELENMTHWVVEHLGPDVHMHFSAFYPDWKMFDKSPNPADTLSRTAVPGVTTAAAS